MLANLLSDLFQQNYSGQVQIVVVEETDSPQTIDDVKHVPIPVRNRGIAFARNIALEHASHEVIVFVDDDCRVRRLGWVTDLEKERLWQQADVFLFPSKDEGFGMPVIEAMAREVPVVTSDGGALPEVAKDAALIVPLSSSQFVTDLAERIDMALHSHELRQRLVRAGKVRASLFSWENSASQLNRVLEMMNG
jgi:glycosyltransferase involved in cell wall biosynthesis